MRKNYNSRKNQTNIFFRVLVISWQTTQFSSHFLQFNSVPSLVLRPFSETTQGRNCQGGLCRTCWVCPHLRSATQSPSSSL